MWIEFKANESPLLKLAPITKYENHKIIKVKKNNCDLKKTFLKNAQKITIQS